MKVYFINVWTSKGARVYFKHCRSLSRDWAMKRKQSWEKKGYKAELIVSLKNQKSYVLD